MSTQENSSVEINPEKDELNLPNRKWVYTLTTLTFIGATIGLIFCIMFIVFWGKLDVVLSKGDQNAKDLEAMLISTIGEQRWWTYVKNNQINDFFLSTRNHYILAAISNALAILGAFLMRTYRKSGFYIYVLSHLLFLVSPFIMILDYEINMRDTLIFVLIATVFIGLYSRSIKFFK
ncbi:MAG: hypothetical protein K1X56_09045 [Flavobacteriales bacterium]|nr:hypothetical protein [Flavobacteriales bacterium]